MKHVKKFNTEEQYLAYKQNNPNITYTAGIINDGNSETIVADQKYVEFEDPEVYRILTTVIPGFDGHGITMANILACTGTLLETPFRNSSIKKFHEFRYFINIHTIQNMFKNSTLEEITMPPTTLSWGFTYYTYSPFSGCTHLKRVNWNNAEPTLLPRHDVETASVMYGLYNQCPISWYPGVLPKTVGTAAGGYYSGQPFSSAATVNKILLPEGLKRLKEPIRKTYTTIYMEFPYTTEQIVISEFTYNCNKSTFIIVLKATTPPELVNVGNTTLKLSGYANFYVPDDVYDDYVANSDWQALLNHTSNSDQYIKLFKLSELPQQYYTWGTIRTDQYLMNQILNAQ